MLAELTETGPILANLAYRPANIPMFRVLSRHRGGYGLSRTHCLPHVHTWKFTLRDAIRPRWLGIRYADFALCAGTIAEIHPLIGPETTILRTCAPDVFRMAEAKPERPYDFPYVVFLEEDIEQPHPDYARLRYAPPDPWAYRSEMNALFDQMGLPVVKAFRSTGDTPNLVYHAEKVLAHSSTALSFAVLWDKRIILLKPNCFKGRPEERHLDAMQEALGDRKGYISKYLGTPEAMAAKRTPEELLKEYCGT